VELKLAYLLCVHNLPEQANTFIRLARAHDDADVFVHVDRKCHPSVAASIERGSGVTVLDERVTVTWADRSLTDAILMLMRAMRATGKKYDFVSLNSVQDLPVRHGLSAALAKRPDAVHMNAHRADPADGRQTFYWNVRWPRSVYGRFERPLHPRRLLRAGLRKLYTWGINLRPNRRTLPRGWDVYRGSTWFCMPGDAALDLLDFLDANPSYYDYFEDALGVDEFFIHTWVMNSRWAARCTGENLTYLNFGKTARDRNHPVPLTLGDVPAIEASGRFFARKFDPGVDRRVIDYFTEKLARRAPVS
jgi:hypothetical protein